MPGITSFGTALVAVLYGVTLVNGQNEETVVNVVGSSMYGYCALTASKRVLCWGAGALVVLGNGKTTNVGPQPNTMGENMIPVNFGADRYAVRIDGARLINNVCAVLNTGELVCWGTNTEGALGIPKPPYNSIGDVPGFQVVPAYLGTNKSALSAAVGQNRGCAHLTDQTVKCFGRFGSYGYGSTTHVFLESQLGDNLPPVDFGTGRTVKKLFAGHDTNCVLLDNNDLKCWGIGTNGILGLENANTIGDQANELGDNLAAVNLGTGLVVEDMSIALVHACAIFTNRKVKCWGTNTYGQLGLGDTNPRGKTANTMGDNLPFVNLGTGRTVLDVCTLAVHTCFVLDNGGVKCIGQGLSPKHGYGDSVQRGDQPSDMGDNLAYVDLGTGRTAIKLGCTHGSTCAVLDNGRVKCWGSNANGALGDDLSGLRGDAANEMGDNMPYVNLGFAPPTSSPTAEPTSSPTPEPTSSPTPEPTTEPTPEPTSGPTDEPTSSLISPSPTISSSLATGSPLSPTQGAAPTASHDDETPGSMVTVLVLLLLALLVGCCFFVAMRRRKDKKDTRKVSSAEQVYAVKS